MKCNGLPKGASHPAGHGRRRALGGRWQIRAEGLRLAVGVAIMWNGSGNQAMKDSTVHDRLAARFEAKCVEMEAAGVFLSQS